MNQLERTEFIITRFGNVVGSSGSIIPIFIDRINNGLSLEVTHEKIIRYLMTIPEAVDLMIYCCEHGTRSDIFCFDMGEPINILELTKKFIELYAPGTQIDIIGLRKGEKMYEELYYSHETKEKTGHEKIFRLKPDSFVFEDFIREYENFLNKDFLQMNPIEIKKYMSDIINVASV
jgi:FlaA1/EpsC-like NDP-sugar epimerase